MWDLRYSDSEYVYGKQPNDFLVQMAGHIPAGRVLCLAEGEGRNAVWLARQGYDVTAVDSSAVGLEKARALADEWSVEIHTVHADLADYDITRHAWQGIVSIFCHLPASLRRQIHEQVVNGLAPGGVFLLEAYTPQQLEFATGGPPTADLMMELSLLRDELTGLDLLYARELQRPVHEGRFHHGTGAVVQILGINNKQKAD